MKGYSPTPIEVASTKPSISLELGMVEKCKECKKKSCNCDKQVYK